MYDLRRNLDRNPRRPLAIFVVILIVIFVGRCRCFVVILIVVLVGRGVRGRPKLDRRTPQRTIETTMSDYA